MQRVVVAAVSKDRALLLGPWIPRERLFDPPIDKHRTCFGRTLNHGVWRAHDHLLVIDLDGDAELVIHRRGRGDALYRYPAGMTTVAVVDQAEE